MQVRQHFVILILILGMLFVAAQETALATDSQSQITNSISSTRSPQINEDEDHFIFLPVILKPPIPTTGNVTVIDIFVDGTGQQEPDEYVEIRNDDSTKIQLEGWTLRDIANHVYTFPEFVMEPGQICRVYTNENHPEWCGFSYGSGMAIWNNTSGDCAYLRDSTNANVDTYCYP